jgi:predicted NUDIX family phosphoesterase
MEEVLVIPKDVFLKNKNDNSMLIHAIVNNHNFLARDKAETDPNYKQIIPYVFARYGNKYLMLKRLNKQTEKRLHGKLSLGIGGHINPMDIIPGNDVLLSGLKRELNEEVKLEYDERPSFLGIINDETTEVGKYHLGLVYELLCVSSSFRILEKDKMEGRWVDVDDIIKNYDLLESWSQVLFEQYIKVNYSYL